MEGETVIESLNIIQHVESLQDVVTSAIPVMLGIVIAFVGFKVAKRLLNRS